MMWFPVDLVGRRNEVNKINSHKVNERKQKAKKTRTKWKIHAIKMHRFCGDLMWNNIRGRGEVIFLILGLIIFFSIHIKLIVHSVYIKREPNLLNREQIDRKKINFGCLYFWGVGRLWRTESPNCCRLLVKNSIYVFICVCLANFYFPFAIIQITILLFVFLWRRTLNITIQHK